MPRALVLRFALWLIRRAVSHLAAGDCRRCQAPAGLLQIVYDVGQRRAYKRVRCTNPVCGRLDERELAVLALIKEAIR
jgi:hypothetical protein